METPELFNVFIEAAMDDLVVSWNERGMEMYFEAHGMVNHAIWADNIFLFAFFRRAAETNGTGTG